MAMLNNQMLKYQKLRWGDAHPSAIAILVRMATMVLTPRLNGEHMMINLNGKLGTPNLWDSLGKNEKRRVASR